MTAATVGAVAPDFTLPDQRGTAVRLNDFRGKNIVLYFYPKDDSPGCTAQACAFRDSYEVFTDAGAEVIGVSADSTAAHQAFATRHHLPFTLVSDADGTLRKAYGIKRTLGLIPGRVTFVIDRDGVIRHVFGSQFQTTKHVDEALAVLRTLP